MNNPLLFLDPDGRDNVIYLFALKGSEKHVKLDEVVEYANKFLQDGMALQTQVVLVMDQSKFDFSKVDETDGFAVLGANAEQATSFIKENLSGYIREGWTGKLDNWKDKSNIHWPETSDAGHGTKGYVTAIDASRLNNVSKEWMSEPSETGGFIVAHGGGHQAGIGDDDPKAGSIMKSGEEIKRYIQGAAGHPWYRKLRYNPVCPSCLSNFATDPTDYYQKKMWKRFGENRPNARALKSSKK